MTVTPVGFVGLGNMGGRMTACLTRAGVDVVGFDPRPGLAEAVGARSAGSPAEVSERADVVMLSLPDSSVVEEVALGAAGLLTAAREGQIVVDLSTASPDSTRRLHDLFAQKGVTLLDAGISGGAAAADKGTLTLMVGGSADDLDRVSTILGHFADKVFHVGDSGAGHATKLLNNFLNAVSLSATAEVMVAAKKAGLDLRTVLDVFNSSSGVNFATMNRFPHIVEGDYLEGGLTNTLMMKDVTLYADYVSTLGVASLHVSGPLASFGLARALGYADRISNTVVDAIGDVSGHVRLQDPAPGEAAVHAEEAP
jgi:3-hydroxyisobutyrate dehydrogenase-like beta-hydroxyacid dehydrogenase